MPKSPALHTILFESTASEGAVRIMVDDTRACLDRLGIDADLCGSVSIALAEALNNIVEHAYAGMSLGQIRLQLDIHANEIRLCLCDHGRELPNGKLPPAQLPETCGPLESLPEGGFGWFLLHDLTDEVSYAREAGENRLNLVFAHNQKVCPS